MVTKVLVALAVMGLTATPGFAQPERKDLQVARDVASQVNRYAFFSVFDDVEIDVQEGQVTLTGKVTKPHKRTDLGQRVARVDGVVDVDNRIEVLPVSGYDDDLRFRLAQAVYSHPAFWKYAAMANPPIHLVVDRGRVTLTGVVQNEVERALARSIVATVSGSFSVTNRLRTDAEVREQSERRRPD